MNQSNHDVEAAHVEEDRVADAGAEDAGGTREDTKNDDEEFKGVECWVDAHIHLDVMPDAQRSWGLDKAKRGRYRALIPGVNPSQWEGALETYGDHPNLDFSVGMHPQEIDENTPTPAHEDWRARLDKALDHPRVVAMGEVGLDWVHWKDDATRAHGEALFVEQLSIAHAHDVPLVLHVVRAHARAVKLLKEHGDGLRGMVHAFSGSLEELRNYQALGWHVGIGTLATYSNARRALDVAREVEPGMWLLETDAPYLAVGRGRRGTGRAEDIRVAAQTIARARGISVAQACKESAETYASLFGR